MFFGKGRTAIKSCATVISARVAAKLAAQLLAQLVTGFVIVDLFTRNYSFYELLTRGGSSQ